MKKKNVNYDQAVMEKYGSEIDVCLGDYFEKGEINTDMAIFKFDNNFYIDDEKKKLQIDPIISPLSFNFEKAERVYYTQEDVDRIIEEKQQEEERLRQEKEE